MGSELPILEYARVDEGGGGDRYRLWFLLAGLPGIVAMFTRAGRGDSLVGGTVRELQGIHRDVFSVGSALAIALAASILMLFTATVWRWLRLDGGTLGRPMRLAGMILAGIHVAGILGMSCSTIAVKHPDEVAGGIGLAIMAICGWFAVRAYGRLGSAEWILVILLSGEIAFYAMIWVGNWNFIGMVNTWQIIIVGTALVRGVEFVYVLRSGRRRGGVG